MKIKVTQPSFPPLSEFNQMLEDIWDRKWLTNGGHYHQELERALANHLGVKYVSLFCNGTIALLTGLKALGITGEVITTPFTFVATSHAIEWNGCTPVFCDIDPDSYNLDPSKIESLISEKTQAIMPVHVYGTPCDVKALKSIADKYDLKVFYDAAHSFGVEVDGESILNFGDLSMMSFHATKVFNTIEGGALITNCPDMKKKIDFLKNFGFAGEESVVDIGINGKMNEVQAAFGLAQLKYVEEQITHCKSISDLYREKLSDVPGIEVLKESDNVKYNYSYFPIVVNEREFGIDRDMLYEILKDNNILSRKYFYPLVSDFDVYKNNREIFRQGSLSVAKKISARVLCLPIYSDLNIDDASNVIDVIRASR
ncbi:MULTISPECIES: DegT/DnrJ/EryC1/StrS aminotransferase family protein [Vibrio]|uniref:Aminotransferase n=9 Tax=Vibrionaceae TaxID=641 RepID=A0A2N7NME0_9VIBR|nr:MULTISPECIES: DegT/DnrJ/EryC1/StrS family aminotransferase [Vibrio]EAQ53110.1 aminotransferase [Vibrio sp. MED222]PMP16969.1 aminotransferase [Vibrio tasmaniensis]TKG28690.1 DegT/DnrJ/EryC1/StrS family aminotransferase [Vibrio tasmaniensis]TKG39498.1 DegT/DnrJ/EryC1/StrS family aminotransferase [Vibrio tasmaniensis]TKG43394.1 DegT/DnrJ/EryC1/StrS family aminotransferase [Vibrio tasmaniensis]